MAPKNDGGGGNTLPPAQLPAGQKNATFHAEKILDVGKALQKDLDDLNKHGTKGSVFDFTSHHDGDPKGSVSQEALGNYPAATGLHATCQAAYTTVRDVYSQFLEAYQGVINTINQNGKNYHATEDKNKQNANHAGASAHPPKAV